jgi:16S rRNA (guanine527-N7)-methyltransferase
MAKLLGYAQPYLRKNVLALFLKGQDVDIELAEATRYWSFEATLRPSLSSPQGHIVQLKRLSRV